MLHIIAFLAAAIATLLTLPKLLKMCHKRGLYDYTDERKIHKNPIPRLGGLVFIPAVAFSLSLVIYLCEQFPGTFTFPKDFSSRMVYMLTGIGMVYYTGIIDDLLNLSARMKFIVQIGAAAEFVLADLIIYDMHGFMGIHAIPYPIGALLTILLVLLIINSINLIDGIDGLAASLSLCAIVTFGWLYHMENRPIYTLTAAALSATLLVFLRYNVWGDAEKHNKTFMGDSGSLLLGIVLSYFAIRYAARPHAIESTSATNIIIPILVLLIPVGDLIRVAIGRLLHHKSIFAADKTHIHHVLMSWGLSQHQALLVLVSIEAILCGVALWMAEG